VGEVGGVGGVGEVGDAGGGGGPGGDVELGVGVGGSVEGPGLVLSQVATLTPVALKTTGPQVPEQQTPVLPSALQQRFGKAG
jgi:hypothetical protein